MSAAQEIAARVTGCREKAQAVLAEIRALVGELPEWSENAEETSEQAVLMAVRGELEEAAGALDTALDYLTPRADDDAPECCAHRQLQALIAAEGQPACDG